MDLSIGYVPKASACHSVLAVLGDNRAALPAYPQIAKEIIKCPHKTQ